MDSTNFEQFLQDRIKVDGKTGNVGGGVLTIKRNKSKISVTSEHMWKFPSLLIIKVNKLIVASICGGVSQVAVVVKKKTKLPA
uniref:Ribosomal protein L22 n=1 Tax=Bos indicus x Bos taurus TaxID=30522 RepID=A0A4W2C582_BOBOX